jgi:acyl-CoA synthetase (AMP-forming)/AMP-acid ligase II
MANFVGRLIERLTPHSQLIDASRGTVHSDLESVIAGMAGTYVECGLRRGDRVVLATELNCESALAYLACMLAGLVAVPVDPGLAEATVGETGARCLWRPRDQVAPSARAHIELTGLTSAEPGPACESTHEDLAALMATSGSSGRSPRFVRVSHGNLVENTTAIVRSQQLGRDDKALLILPLFYCFGLSVLHTHLWAGGSVVIQRQFMFPQKALDSLRSHACTTIAGVPTSYMTLLDRTDYAARPCPSLRRQLQAGGALPSAVIEALRDAQPDAGVHVMYGQTEATARISSLAPDEWDGHRGSVGRPLEGLDVTLRPIAEGGSQEIGELLVRGPSITSGYWGEPLRSDDDWFATGDLARIDAEGFIYIEGRLSEFVKIRGVRVSFAEIESRLGPMRGLREVAVCGVPDPALGEALLLVGVPEEPHPDLRALETAMRAALPPVWTISEVRFVSCLPRTGSGKLARGKLAGMPVLEHAP